MTRRFTFLATLALVASFATAAQAQNSILSYGHASSVGPAFTYSSSGSFQVQSKIFVTFLNPDFLIDPTDPTPPILADFLVQASTTNSAVNGAPVREQSGFTGTFSITAGTTNILSGSFSSGILKVTNNSASFSTTNASFESDIFIALFNESFDFTALSLAPTFPGVSGGNFVNFTGQNVSGNFAAIPEPATLAMAGLGIVAMPLAARVIRRRRDA